MIDEEKEAIEILKEAQDRMIQPKMLKDVKYTNEDYSKAIDIILNLIGRQQEKIKSLTAENDFLKFMYRGTTEYKAIESFIEENNE